MITLQQALLLCANRIAKGDTHPNYDRVVELAKLYDQLITGEGQDELINQVFKDLTKEELDKIKQLYFPISNAIANSLMFAFSKIYRTEPIYKKIDFEKDESGDKKIKLDNAIAKYYGRESIEYYMEKRFHDLSFIDPNTFIVTEFAPFNSDTQVAQPYPFEVSSTQAVNYSYQNMVLQFLLVQMDIKYADAQGAMQKGRKLTIYLDNDAITFTQVAFVNSDGALSQYGQNGGAFYGGDPTKDNNAKPATYVFNNEKYSIQYFRHNQKQVPAQVVGYIPDKKTNGLTFVNPLHYGALNYLKKSIKAGAEMDITANRHAFPQKISFVKKCSLDGNGKCPTSGQMQMNCKVCGGSGLPEHTSSKDVVRFELPRDPQDMFNLDSVLTYKFPPIDGVKWMEEYIYQTLKAEAFHATFNSEVFNKDMIVKTATEATLTYQNIYDTLTPYGNKYASFWRDSVKMIANTLDITDVIVALKFPMDFKLKSMTDLLNDLKLANDSGAPVFVRDGINNDVVRLLYADRPLELQKYDAKKALFPFPGKSKDEILMAISTIPPLATYEDAVLWANFDKITEQLEAESGRGQELWADILEPAEMEQLKKANSDQLIWFYDLPYSLQSALVYAKTDEIIAEVAEEKTATNFTDPNAGQPA